MLEPALLAQLDRALLGDPSLVKKTVLAMRQGIMGCEAREHPYGFVVVNIGTVVQDRRVVYRLHIWPEGFTLAGSAELMIHDHVYDIRSHILIGAIVQHEYVEEAAGEEFACYRGLYDGPHSVLQRIEGSKRIVESTVSRIGAGETYTLPAGALHMVKVDPSIFTATILRTEYDEAQDDPVILAPFDSPVSYRFDRELLPDAETAAVVEELFRRLENG